MELPTCNESVFGTPLVLILGLPLNPYNFVSIYLGPWYKPSWKYCTRNFPFPLLIVIAVNLFLM